MGLIKKVYNNTGKPKGLLGRLVVTGMNAGAAEVSDWGISHLDGLFPEVIADLGCGGGRNARKLLERYPKAKLFGLDYSKVSAEKAASVNQDLINQGRCKIFLGAVEKMPFRNDVIDLATAFETVYFWPGPVQSFREVFRVLKKGGIFMIVNAMDGFDEKDDLRQDRVDNMAIYTKDDLIEHLQEAGFLKIAADQDEKRHFLCVIAQKD